MVGKGSGKGFKIPRANIQELQANPHYRAEASPDPNGTRAQRRAWAKLTKTKMPRISADTTDWSGS